MSKMMLWAEIDFWIESILIWSQPPFAKDLNSVMSLIYGKCTADGDNTMMLLCFWSVDRVVDGIGQLYRRCKNLDTKKVWIDWTRSKMLSDAKYRVFAAAERGSGPGVFFAIHDYSWKRWGLWLGPDIVGLSCYDKMYICLNKKIQNYMLFQAV